jgi:hypothetical protein
MLARFELAGCFVILMLLPSCSREDRILQQPPAANQVLNTVQISGLNPGANSIPTPPPSNMYQESAYAVSEGQTLYEEYNCVGCHAHGGGGIGPALMIKTGFMAASPATFSPLLCKEGPTVCLPSEIAFQSTRCGKSSPMFVP